MIVFDTDHLSILQRPEDSHYEQLVNAMHESPDQNIVATVISLEEHMRGWLAAIRRAKSETKQIVGYARLLVLMDFYRTWTILPFDQPAARLVTQLRKQRIRVGTSDLKIASIALVHEARLVSSNLRDFERIPGLVVEDWLR